MPPEQPSNADPTSDILDWLASPPSQNLADEICQLGQYLDALYSPTVSSAQFYRCVELFYSRTLALCGECRREMRSYALPHTAEQLKNARILADSAKRVAAGFERVVRDAKAGAIRTQRKLNETAAARALRLLGEQYLIVSQAGMQAEPDIWRIAYRLYTSSRIEAGAAELAISPAETALFAFKRLLALVSLDPLSLSPAELDWSAEFLSRVCGQLHIQEKAPPSLDGAWFWLDPQGSMEPVACIRRKPAEGRPSLFFSTSALGRRAAELLIRHESGRSGVELEPDELFPGVQPASLLSRLRQRWSAPPNRELPRRRQDYTVEACLGLPAIWEVLRQRSAKSLSCISHWNVLNESPGGYAIMHLHGDYSSLSAGMAVGLRRHSEDPWNICLVRWLRSDATDQVEIGLQVVSRGAIPVQVGFKGRVREPSMSNALVLPVLPALRQHQAVMAQAGTYVSRRFALVSDIDRLYVAQCRLLSLDMQTASVELFQFEIDPYPI